MVTLEACDDTVSSSRLNDSMYDTARPSSDCDAFRPLAFLDDASESRELMDASQAARLPSVCVGTGMSWPCLPFTEELLSLLASERLNGPVEDPSSFFSRAFNEELRPSSEI